MTFITLSYSIDEDTQVYGDTQRPKIKLIKSRERGDSSNGYSLYLCNHTGTHIDAPMHFVDEGKKISDYSSEELSFNKPKILNTKKNEGEWIERKDVENLDLEDYDCLFFKTGFSRFREKIYRENGPGISPEAIELIQEKIPNNKMSRN